MPKNKGVERLT